MLHLVLVVSLYVQRVIATLTNLRTILFQKNHSESYEGKLVNEITKGIESCLLDEYENDDNEADEIKEKSYLGRHEVTLQSPSSDSEG